MVLIVLFVFIFGLIWGSFLNVVIYRTTHGTSPLSGRSQCPKCKKVISWKNNIPLISFFLLHGRCVNCKTRISWRYPVVEFMTGILFVWWYLISQSFFSLAGSPFSILQPVFWLLGGFGFGDVKLAPSLALLLGWPRVSVGIFSAFVIGAVLGLTLILFGKRRFGQTIPFGPFLIVGVLVGLLFGNSLWGWYWGLI
ncbi:prepilin peptidase [Candidatus Collierbacteria bacterium]|nr:prepilin peptidase [Candidatus Collierbacteria bacterium]